MGIPLRVLMIEDSEDDAALLERELRRGDYDVHMGAGGMNLPPWNPPSRSRVGI